MYIYLSEDSMENLVEINDMKWRGICTASTSVEQALVDDVCDYFTLLMNLRNSSGWGQNALNRGNYKLMAGEEVVLMFNIWYSYIAPNLNGLSFSLDFEPIEIEFGLTPASYYNTAGVNEEV